MAYQEPDAAVAAQGVQQETACTGIDMVGRLVDRQDLGSAAQGASDLYALSLTVAQARPARGPLRLDAEPAPDLGHGRFLVGQQVVPISGRGVCTLGTIGGVAGDGDAAGTRRENAGRKKEERGLARAVRPDNAGPALGDGECAVRKQRL
jgi:hypothetical protein